MGKMREEGRAALAVVEAPPAASVLVDSLPVARVGGEQPPTPLPEPEPPLPLPVPPEPDPQPPLPAPPANQPPDKLVHCG